MWCPFWATSHCHHLLLYREFNNTNETLNSQKLQILLPSTLKNWSHKIFKITIWNLQFGTSAIYYVYGIWKWPSWVVISTVAKPSPEKLRLQSQSTIFTASWFSSLQYVSFNPSSLSEKYWIQIIVWLYLNINQISVWSNFSNYN